MKYSKEHTWVTIEGDTATVGISHFAQQQLGDIVYVDVESVGTTLAQDAIFGTIEAIKTVSDLFMPVSGEVIAFNEPLIRKPEVVNTDPYGEGWMIQIAMSAPEEWDTLLTAEEYRQLIDA